MANKNLINTLMRSRLVKAKQKAVTTTATPVVEDKTLQTWIKSVETAIKQVASTGVKKSDLVDYGLVGIGNNGNLEALIPKDDADYTVPLAVLNLSAGGGYSSVTLDWETPKNKSFGYNAVYRAEIDDFGMAAQIGSTLGDVYTDHVGNGIKAYYWVRTISKYGVEGQLSPSVTAETSVNIPYLLEQLTDKITNSHLAQSLKTQIEKIELVSLDLGKEVNNRIQQAQEFALSFSNLQNELTNGLSDNSAAITNVQTTLNSKIENIAQEISLVTAGVGEQFDTFKIWFFDENTTEGWTSSGGVPEVQNGWIRAFLNGTDSTLISPPENNFSGSAYPDIRFRVKRVGNPQWNATLSWGDGFNLYVSIPEPIWNEENGIGTVQKNVDWIGDIGQIKLKLAVTQDESNYYAVDWFAFGRPSPAASWSAIGEVKTAIANENYARTQYQTLNEAKWSNNDVIYRGLVQQAIDIAADENGITAERLDNFIIEGTTHYAGDDEEYAGDDSIFVGHVTEEVLRIEGDDALLEEIDLRAIQIGEKFSAAIKEESRIRVDQNSVLVEKINTVQSTVDGVSSSVEQTMTAIDGINAEWKVKVQANGTVSGVALGINGEESDFIIMTNRFSVVSPNGWVAVPFVIDSDGRTIMNTAVIKDGSIDNLKVGWISADKITAGDIAADRMKANIVQAVSITATNLESLNLKVKRGDIEDLAVNTLQIADNAVTVPVAVTTAAAITVGNAYTSVQSLNVPSDMGHTLLTFGAVFSFTGYSPAQQILCRILKNNLPILEDIEVHFVQHESIAKVSDYGGKHGHTATVDVNVSIDSAGSHGHGHSLSTNDSGSHGHSFNGSTGYSNSHSHSVSGSVGSTGSHSHSVNGSISSDGSHSHNARASADRLWIGESGEHNHNVTIRGATRSAGTINLVRHDSSFVKGEFTIQLMAAQGGDISVSQRYIHAMTLRK